MESTILDKYGKPQKGFQDIFFETGTSFKFYEKPSDEIEFFLGLAIHTGIFHLIDVGLSSRGGGWGVVRGPESPLDFRTNFTQTWLALNVISSFSLATDKKAYSALIKVRWKETYHQTTFTLAVYFSSHASMDQSLVLLISLAFSLAVAFPLSHLPQTN